jgi:hypothetical protein
MGSRRPAGTLWAVAAIMVACTSCAGSSSAPARVSVTAAARNPCVLITQAEAQAIVGKAGEPQFESGFSTDSGFTSNYCTIADHSDGTTIDITVEHQSYDPLVAEILISNATPVAAVGHHAECGLALASTEPGPLSEKTFELYSEISSHYVLEVSGAASCAVDARFASEAYSHL